MLTSLLLGPGRSSELLGSRLPTWAGPPPLLCRPGGGTPSLPAPPTPFDCASENQAFRKCKEMLLSQIVRLEKTQAFIFSVVSQPAITVNALMPATPGGPPIWKTSGLYTD